MHRFIRWTNVFTTDSSCVDTIKANHAESSGASYSTFENRVDRFHDKFAFSSRQRRKTTQSLMNRQKAIVQVYDSFTPQVVERSEPYVAGPVGAPSVT